jgi:hypothetical protein
MFLLDQEIRCPPIATEGGDDGAMHAHKVDEIASTAAAMNGPSGNRHDQRAPTDPVGPPANERETQGVDQPEDASAERAPRFGDIEPRCDRGREGDRDIESGQYDARAIAAHLDHLGRLGEAELVHFALPLQVEGGATAEADSGGPPGGPIPCRDDTYRFI